MTLCKTGVLVFQYS